MSPSMIITVLSAIIVAGVAFAVVKWAFKKDTEIEDRRRAAVHLAAVLKQHGLVKIPAFLGDYAVGDYSGMADKIKNTAELFLDGEEAVMKELAGVFDRVLAAKLVTEQGRALIASRLADAQKPAVVTV